MQDRTTKENPWAALIGRGKDGLREASEQVVASLRARGLDVAGAVHVPLERDGMVKGYDVMSLRDGARVPLARASADPDLCDYAFVAEGFAGAAGWTAEASDVVVFEMGKIEAGHRGHWPAMEAALHGPPRLLLLQLRPSVLASVALELPEPVADVTLPATPEALTAFAERVAAAALATSRTSSLP